MDNGLFITVCFIGFFVLLDFATKVMKKVSPFAAAYFILDKTNKNREERLKKEQAKISEERLALFRKTYTITDNEEI